MSAFDHQAGSRFAGGQVPTYASDATLSVLDDLVIQVVDRCGFQVMADIAYQYPAPLYGWFLATAASALGEISTLPPDLRCADLAALGWGPKQAVDYWFLWNGPDLMDADLNGIPCQTVWPGVDRYMPAYY